MTKFVKYPFTIHKSFITNSDAKYAVFAAVREIIKMFGIYPLSSNGFNFETFYKNNLKIFNESNWVVDIHSLIRTISNKFYFKLLFLNVLKKIFDIMLRKVIERMFYSVVYESSKFSAGKCQRNAVGVISFFLNFKNFSKKQEYFKNRKKEI